MSRPSTVFTHVAPTAGSHAQFPPRRAFAGSDIVSESRTLRHSAAAAIHHTATMKGKRAGGHPLSPVLRVGGCALAVDPVRGVSSRRLQLSRALEPSARAPVHPAVHAVLVCRGAAGAALGNHRRVCWAGHSDADSPDDGRARRGGDPRPGHVAAAAPGRPPPGRPRAGVVLYAPYIGYGLAHRFENTRAILHGLDRPAGNW